jgi:hypothetical protein
MPDLFAPTLAEQAAEVRREVALRERVYPLWVRKGDLSQHRADKQLAAMRAALKTLETLEKQEAKHG